MATLRSKSTHKAVLLAPLFAFLAAFYFLPIASFLFRSVDTDELRGLLPRTTVAIGSWSGEELPSAEVFTAFAEDLRASSQSAAILGRRLNAIEPGLRTAVRSATSRANALQGVPPSDTKQAIIEADPLWGDPSTWRIVKRETRALTPTFLLNAVDVDVDQSGATFKSGGESIFLPIFARTLLISMAVTAICLLIGYPVAWAIAMAPPGIAAWLMVLVLVPFWISILARTAAWIIILQGNGPINSLLMWLGLVDEPLSLIFNRFSVILVMVHVMLPFLVLPLYNSIRAIPKSYFQAAANLGAPPHRAFFHVILPLTIPGMWAGSFIVFILSIGYYITPALVGGASDQMISSYIAFYTNHSVNWALASALSGWLLAMMLVFVLAGQRLVGPAIRKAS